MLNKMDEELISKYLDGEASPEEAIEIDEWINASVENKKFFEKIEQSSALFKKNKMFSSPDVAQDWLALKEKTIEKASVKTRILFTPFRIAASLLLIAVAAYILFTTSAKVTSDTDLAWITKKSTDEIVATTFTDQSKVTLYRNSVITYPEKFESKIREVKLLKGEAYFDVAHNPKQPFIVTVNEIQVKVLGTAFNIQSDKDLNITEIQVTRGSVMIYNDFGKEIVNAGQIGTYNKETKHFSVTSTAIANLNTTSYATQSFDFQDVTLQEVTDNLSKTFGVTFQFKSEKLKNCRMSGEFKTRPLDFILKVISTTFGIEYKVDGNTIELSGNACE